MHSIRSLVLAVALSAAVYPTTYVLAAEPHEPTLTEALTKEVVSQIKTEVTPAQTAPTAPNTPSSTKTKAAMSRLVKTARTYADKTKVALNKMTASVEEVRQQLDHIDHELESTPRASATKP